LNNKCSAVIIAKNEEITMEKCLQALNKITDDIILVLDNTSDDRTEEIARKSGASVFKKKWEGYSVNKKFGIDKAKNDWIIWVDADEVINDELASNILMLNPTSDKVYLMNRLTYMGNYPVKHCGWFPDWNIRLFNRKVMKWNDNYVHEKLESNHHVIKEKLSGLIDHYSFRDEAHMKEKFELYSKLRAEEWKKTAKTPNIVKKLFGPYFRFFRTYLLKGGFLDGKTGFIIAKNEYHLKKNELKYYYESKFTD